MTKTVEYEDRKRGQEPFSSFCYLHHSYCVSSAYRQTKNRLKKKVPDPFFSSAFTLIELLVVIAIISLLVSILVPSLTKAKDLARSVVCGSNLRSLGVAGQLYVNQSDGKYPYFSHSPRLVGDPYWQLSLLYAMGEATEEQMYSYDDESEGRMNAHREMFHCPCDPEDYTKPDNYYLYSYGGNIYLSGASAENVPETARVLFLLDIQFRPRGLHSLNEWDFEVVGWRHPLSEGFNLVFCDGHVENQKEYLIREQIVPNPGKS